MSWATRCKIALEAAEGLAYLHHDYNPPVLHCDVKSNNILLDLEYEAKAMMMEVPSQVCVNELRLKAFTVTKPWNS
ncbi:hypothetical protein O6H91_17G071500 [Diphasiastrum complanatum]|uniref:Uncharacterized protein n=1 Tax=Diphasiastrum complanatum TaxID=34168 RepID=A0ACC2B807_DIPCM|nr:hypothetical protein O6H91_17G071500 [Diphasiastrum complanatum]